MTSRQTRLIRAAFLGSQASAGTAWHADVLTQWAPVTSASVQRMLRVNGAPARWSNGAAACLVVVTHVGVLHILPPEAHAAAAPEGAVLVVLPQEVRHYLPGYDVPHIVGLRQLAECHARHLALQHPPMASAPLSLQHAWHPALLHPTAYQPAATALSFFLSFTCT